MSRSLSEIAAEIRKTWKPKIAVSAAEYVNAMASMNSISDPFYADPGTEVVARFLTNATTWRGEDARRIKKELNTMLNNQLKLARR